MDIFWNHTLYGMTNVTAMKTVYIHLQEKTAVLQSFKDRARLVAETFNSMEGFQCNEVMGAMYAFPQVFIPKKAQEEAKVCRGPPWPQITKLLHFTSFSKDLPCKPIVYT